MIKGSLRSARNEYQVKVRHIVTESSCYVDLEISEKIGYVYLIPLQIIVLKWVMHVVHR